MKKYKRRLTRWLLPVALMLAAAMLMGAGQLKPTSNFYANDFANVLTDETESYIVERSASLEQQTGAQIVVLTVDTLDGVDPADYALRVGREWGIGSGEKNNGLLLLLAVGDGEIRVEVGPGLEGALNDAKVGRLIDNYAIGHYKKGDFETGTLELYNALLSEVMVEYGLEALPGYEPKQQSSGIGEVLLLIFLVLVIVILINRSKPPRGGGGGGRRHTIFYGGGGFGGGGFGGGSSGGGGFSSGGGGFGGGAASVVAAAASAAAARAEVFSRYTPS